MVAAIELQLTELELELTDKATTKVHLNLRLWWRSSFIVFWPWDILLDYICQCLGCGNASSLSYTHPIGS